MTCVEEKKLIRLSCISQLYDFPLLSEEAQNFMYGLKAATTEANVQTARDGTAATVEKAFAK
jgi:hypothetical protein